MFFDTLRSWSLQSLVLFRRSLHCVTSSTYSKYLYSRSPVTNACAIDVVIIKLEMTLIWSKCKLLFCYLTASISTVCPASIGARRVKVKCFHVEEYCTIFMRCKLEGTDMFSRSSYNLTVESYVYGTVHHLYSWVKRNQLDATYFIIYSILIQCSTCFGR